MAECLRPLTSVLAVHGLKPGPAIAPLGKPVLSELPCVQESDTLCT